MFGFFTRTAVCALVKWLRKVTEKLLDLRGIHFFFFFFLQIGQFSHVDFQKKRVMKCAFNRAAGIRRHVENLAKLRAERRLFM